MTKRVFISPSKYVQGPGVIKELGKESQNYGQKPFILADANVWKIVGEDIETSFKEANQDFHYEKFNGEASNNEISRLSELARYKEADLVIGVGGGKTLDTAKAIADNLEVPIIIVPTTASTDAPTSALSVIYSDEGVFESYKFYKRNPNLVLVDSTIIVNAPARFFASGIGDAMATSLEAKAANKTNSNAMAGGRATLAGLAIAEAAERTLFEHGIAAYKAVQENIVTPAVESVIEANTLLSGLGFENGGLAAAHAIHNGFTALIGDIHGETHGEKVSYGVLTQLVLENKSEEEILRYADFFKALDLPTTLADIKLDKASYEDLVSVGKQATVEGETMANQDLSITPEQIANAILAVDTITNHQS